MKIFVTRYALTAGIVEYEAKDVGDGMVEVVGEGILTLYFHGNDWHRDRAAAVARAEQMRRTKLAKLEKQRKKIEAMVFE